MITEIIYNLIASQFPDIVEKKKTLFLEHGVGNKNIVIKTVSTINPIKSIKGMRYTKVYFIINGWNMAEALGIGEKIVAFLEEKEDQYTLNGKIFHIKNVTIDPHPYILDSSRVATSQTIVCGVGVYYIIE